jgi:hypothetical protein
VKCDALQVSVDDLQSLRLEEERLKFERDTAFEAAMAGLERVRELERRQGELRERGMEMLRRGLKTLDELDAAEEKEREEKENAERQVEAYQESTPIASFPELDPSFFDMDPSLLDHELRVVLGFDGGTPPQAQSSQ